MAEVVQEGNLFVVSTIDVDVDERRRTYHAVVGTALTTEVERLVV